MLRFVLSRLSVVIPTFIGITILTFSLIRLVPGDPVELMAGERGLTPERHAELLAGLGLDRPLHEQYLMYVWDIFHGDLGQSFVTKTGVWEEFLALFPATVELSFFALLFAISLGIPAGIYSALKKGSIFDHCVSTVTLTGYSMPIFWWALLMILLFSVHFEVTPVSGRISVIFWIESVTGFMLIDTLLAGEYEAFFSSLHHLILPSIVLGTIPLAYITRMTRSSMLEVLHEDYVRTAKAKGLSRFRVIYVHALRNALIPVITIIGLQIGALLAGAILTETIFAWPGIGKWIVEAIHRRDYPTVQGGVLIIATMVILVNLCVDILYGFINPRIRHR